ncbi:MAG TPA: hypothetical protein VEZ12_19840, partial [Herpetosiphonaceae bacterium]|nr:hypothetical protein [Herpetosiphonaceae bacterium]
FETLTGRVPFQGATPQLIIAHLYTPPPRVSLLDPLLPPEIDSVLDRALAKEPSARFASVVAFVEALREVSINHGLPPARVDAIAALARPAGSSAGQDTIALPQAAGTAPAKPQAFLAADVLSVPPATPRREQAAAPPRAIARKPSIPVPAPQVLVPDQSPAAPAAGVERPPRRFTSRRLIRPWIPADQGGAARAPHAHGRRSPGFASPWLVMIVILLVGMSGLFVYQGFRARAQTTTASGGLGTVFAATATPDLLPTGAVTSPTPALAARPTLTPNSVPPPTIEAAPATPAATSAAATLPPRTAPIGGGATIVFQDGAALNLLDAGDETISQISGATQPAGPAAISPDGRLVLFDGVIEGKRRIFSYDRTSKEVKQYVPGDDEAFHPFWAPDGSRVVYAAVRDGNTDIWQMDVRTQGMERLTDDPAEDDYPSYSPDGSKIVWERRRPEGWRIFSMDRDGERRIVDPPGGADDRYPRISPDGNRLVFASSRGRVDGGLDLFVVPLDGGAPVRLTDPRRGSSQGPQWSPDGKMLVFFGDPAGNDDIFTLRLSEPERITAVTHTAEDERWPTWGP